MKANGWDPNEEAEAELGAPADASVVVSEEDETSSQDSVSEGHFFCPNMERQEASRLLHRKNTG